MPRTLKQAWYSQRSSARHRGIEFLLTFEDWLKIWVDSGHFNERGRQRGQYVMARFGDTGPYAIGNVQILKQEDNTKELWSGKRQELIDKMSVATLGKPKPWMRGKTIPAEQIARMVVTRKKTGYCPQPKSRSLTTEQVGGIRKLADTIGAYKIGKIMGVNWLIVRQILLGKTYRDV